MSVQVPKGYKQTEVGVIPEDWSVLRLAEVLLKFQNGYAFSSSGYKEVGTPIITMAQIGLDGSFNFDENKVNRWDVSKKIPEKFLVRQGDLLIAMTDVTPEKNLIGRMTIANIQQEAYLNQRVGLLKIKEDRVIANYLVSNSNLKKWRSYCIAVASLGVQANISTPDIKKGLVALPSVHEQRRIAEALSDADALIESLEQLIAKKRQIKQGAMQELLTGQRRLPGFIGEWARKKLGDVASLYQPVTISASQFTESGYPVYGANGVVGYFNDFNHSSWQVTVTCRGSTCGTVNRTVEKCWITGNAMVVNCEESTLIDKNFIYYKLLSSDLKKCITGTGQPQIIRGPLADFETKIPIDLSEQRSIAEILLALDDEIDLLAQRLDKARQIKQSMMQELLTGRIRLI